MCNLQTCQSLHAPDAKWNAESLAIHTQVALQGAFIMAKAQGDLGATVQWIAHLRRYVHGLLAPNSPSYPQTEVTVKGTHDENHRRNIG